MQASRAAKNLIYKKLNKGRKPKVNKKYEKSGQESKTS